MNIEIPFTNFPGYQGQQEPIIEAIVESEKKFIFVNAPTGTGKSLIGMMAGHKLATHSNYVCTTKMLQNQLVFDFPEAEVMKGRANYECLLNEDGRNPLYKFPDYTCADCDEKCLEHGKGIKNDEGDMIIEPTCIYELKKRKVMKARYRILNLSYLLNEANYVGQLSNQDVTILDEADTLDSDLSRFISLEVSDRNILKYGLVRPKFVTKLDSWKEWALKSTDHLNSLIRKFAYRYNEKGEIDTNSKKEMKQLKLFHGNISRFHKVVDDNWIFQARTNTGYSKKHAKDHKNESWLFQPIWLTPELAHENLWRHSNKFIVMSATLPKIEVASRLLGIEIDEIDYFDIPSDFPVANRKVFFPGIAKVTNESPELFKESFDKILVVANEIIDHHAPHKGIIHTQSYKNRDLVMEACQQKMLITETGQYIDRLVTHDGQNREQKVRDFTDSPYPLIMVSPSLTRGLDLRDDKGRFCIMVKAPYLNLGDKVNNERLNRGKVKKGGEVYKYHFGSMWYEAATVQSIEQACGRVVRHKDDWGYCYVLDDCYSRLHPYFQDWFREAITRSGSLGFERKK